MAVFRKLFPNERDLYRAHLHRLAPADRFARFAGTVSAAAIDRHIDRLDWMRTVVVGAIDRGIVVGAAELCTAAGSWPDEAEVALSVEGTHQNRGVGASLLRRVLTIARNRRITRLHFHCLAENRRMQAMTVRAGGLVERAGPDVSAVVSLGPPNQFSLAMEAMEDGAGAFNSLLDSIRMAPPPLAA